MKKTVNEQRIGVTNHAFKRAKKRLGLNRKATRRMARKAYCQGLRPLDTTGGVKFYLETKRAENGTVRIYGEYIYVFVDFALVTMYEIPQILKREVYKLKF